jgi:hypothetical protein
VIQNDDPRLCLINLALGDGSVTLVNCYLPTSDNPLEQTEYFSKLASIYELSESANVIIAGDFNCDPIKHSNFQELANICDNSGLLFCDIEQLPPSTFTYFNEALDSKSWIDHILTSRNMSSDITDVSLKTPSPSDHLLLTFNYTFRSSKCGDTEVSSDPWPRRLINWKKADQVTLTSYYQKTEQALGHLLELYAYRPVVDVNILCSDIVKILQSAEEDSASSVRTRRKIITGWNDLVKKSYKQYKSAFNMWKLNQNNGQLRQDVLRSKSAFKFNLRKCNRNKKQLQADKLAEVCYEKNFNSFWKNVNCAVKSKKTTLANTLEGITGVKEIALFWKNYFKSLFDSKRTASDLINPVNDFTDFSIDEIITVCNNLKKGKSKGPDNLCAEHIIYAHENIQNLLLLLMNNIVKTSVLPEFIVKVSIVPIIKKKGLDATKMKNYRPIALATTLSKILERLLLSRVSKQLETCDNQFGYKKKIGTEMAIFSLKQIISYYINNDTPVYVTYLDASQAFNKVDHRLLIVKLIDRGFPNYFVNLLINWFDSQRFLVTWGNTKSQDFSVRQGVRQGGILSAYLYALYMDNLSVILNNTEIGARIAGKVTNHIMYADDICLLTTTLSAMHKLIKLCNSYAISHNLEFNSSKTELQCFTPKSMSAVKDDVYVNFNGAKVQHNCHVKYLGYTIASKVKYGRVVLDDDIEIKLRIGELYMRANMIKCYFSRCSFDVKCKLFQTYLSSIYCCSTWNCDIGKTHPVKVAHNNALRIVFNLPKRCSASEAFVQRRLGNINFILRTAVYSIKQRLSLTKNVLLKSTYEPLFVGRHRCNLSNVWNKLLYTNNVTID